MNSERDKEKGIAFIHNCHYQSVPSQRKEKKPTIYMRDNVNLYKGFFDAIIVLSIKKNARFVKNSLKIFYYDTVKKEFKEKPFRGTGKCFS